MESCKWFQHLLDIQFIWNFEYSFKVVCNIICKCFQGSILSGAGSKGQKLSPPWQILWFNFLYVYKKLTSEKFNIEVHCRWWYSILVFLVFSEIYLNRDRFHWPITVYLCQILQFILLSVLIKQTLLKFHCRWQYNI